jgi:hypothetical protein
MTISTRSKFYYGYTVDQDNQAIDFNEGAGELQASLNIGNYTMTELAVEVARALTAAGTQEYSCTVNRNDRKYTISATSNFDLLFISGTRSAVSAKELLGYITDQLIQNSYTSANSTGNEYKPQFLLQDYVTPDDLREANFAQVNESASGIVEVVRFGIRKFFEFNITFITNIAQGFDAPIENNAQGVEDARAFLQFITDKNKIEFMPDRNTTSTYYKILVEKTAGNSNGTGYRLKELYSKNLAGYYETGKTQFRLIED